jgi:glycosyltransferase involved in cell wall biosynthesis
VIVADSDSHDGTQKLKHSFPIRFISIRDRNRQRARNLEISIADREIIAFLDDDVAVDKDWLNSACAHFDYGMQNSDTVCDDAKVIAT